MAPLARMARKMRWRREAAPDTARIARLVSGSTGSFGGFIWGDDGSDTIGLLYLFDNSFKSGIYYYKSNQSIEGYMLQLSLDTE